MHGPCGGKWSLRPDVDLVGCEVHGGVSHGMSYGPDLGWVSVAPILEVPTQFVTGTVDIGLHGPERQGERVTALPSSLFSASSNGLAARSPSCRDVARGCSGVSALGAPSSDSVSMLLRRR